MAYKKTVKKAAEIAPNRAKRATFGATLPPYVYLKKGEWYVRLRFRSGTGKRISIARRCLPETEERADELAQAILASYEALRHKKAAQTLEAHFERFLAAKKPTVSPKTFSSYQWLYDKYIRDSSLSRLELPEIRPLDIQEHYATIPTAKLVRKVHTLLNMALLQAVSWEVIEKTPCRGLILPKKVRPQVKIMSPGQASKFMKVAMTKYPILALALETGMRPGELVALKWTDIDFANRTITVSRAISLGKVKETKTGKGRTIEISLAMCDVLKGLKRGPYVFPSQKGTPLNVNNLNNRMMKQACKDAKIPRFHLYALRHTSLSLLVANGVNIKAVSERAGHSTAQLTLDVYSHVVPTIKSGAVEVLESLYGC